MMDNVTQHVPSIVVLSTSPVAHIVHVKPVCTCVQRFSFFSGYGEAEGVQSLIILHLVNRDKESAQTRTLVHESDTRHFSLAS